MWLFILLVVVPIIEIALFIQVGGAIGLWPTLATVVLTALIGSVLLRSQGLATMTRLQDNLQTGKDPIDPIANGALILVAGVVLLTPGFFTDAVGLALLIPQVRKLVIAFIASRITAGSVNFYTSNMNSAPPRDHSDDTVEADYTVIDDEDGEKGDSGWTKH